MGGREDDFSIRYLPEPPQHNCCSSCYRHDQEIFMARREMDRMQYRLDRALSQLERYGFEDYQRRYYPSGAGGMRMFYPEQKKSMSLTTLAKKVLDSDLRAFIKAGILDNDLEVTDEGVKFLMAQYLSENKAKLAKEARKKIKEDKGKDEE